MKYYKYSLDYVNFFSFKYILANLFFNLLKVYVVCHQVIFLFFFFLIKLFTRCHIHLGKFGKWTSQNQLKEESGKGRKNLKKDDACLHNVWNNLFESFKLPHNLKILWNSFLMKRKFFKDIFFYGTSALGGCWYKCN